MFRVNFSHSKPKGLFIDEKGQLRVSSQANLRPKSKVEEISPKELYRICAGLIVLLSNAFVFLVLYYFLVLKAPAHITSFQGTYYTIAAILASLSFSLSLFFYVLFKVYESRLEVSQVLIEVDRFPE